MMTLKKQVTVAAITLIVAGSGALGVVSSRVFAEDANHQTSLVQKIAQKFNLNQDEVQAVFDEEHNIRDAARETKHSEYLSQLVADGKITEAQKQLLIQKHAEMRANRPDRSATKSLTPDERKAQMDAKRQELDTWAKQNGIDPQYLMGPMMKGMKGMAKPTNQ